MDDIFDIETEALGVLYGRDCIYIDTVTLDDNDSLTFSGEINGYLASKIRKGIWIPYKLEFKRVIAYFACELDTYENLVGGRYLDHGDFTIIENSTKLLKLPVRGDFDRSEYKHFRVFTYDMVFDIFAVSYEFFADLENSKPMGQGS